MFGSSPHVPWVAALSTRTAVLLAAWIGLALSPVLAPPWQAFPHDPYVDGFARFDTSWYQSIWEYGYSYTPGEQSNVAFFPLYPLLVGALAQPLELWMSPLQAFCLAGAIVSHLAFALALVGIHRLASRRFGVDAASRAVWLVATSPFALFFSAVYTESLFLCLAVWAFERGEARRWWTASALAAGCVLTRVPGLLVGFGLGIEYLRTRRWRRIDRDVLAFALPLAAAAALAAYFQHRFGDPLVFSRTQASWGRDLGIDHLEEGVRRVLEPGRRDVRVLTALYVGSIPLVALLSVVVWRRLGPGYAVFAGGAFLLAVSTSLEALGRYELVLFPLWICAGRALGRRTLVVCAIAGLATQLWLLHHFTHWRLVT
jgi:hypothetical protein